MPDVFTAGAQLWISSKASEALFQLIDVAVSLCLAPLRLAVLPDVDEIAFRERAYKNPPHQRLDRRRAFALIFFISSSTSSPLSSPSINA